MMTHQTLALVAAGVAALPLFSIAEARANADFPTRLVWQCGKVRVTWSMNEVPDHLTERPRSWLLYEVTGIEKSDNRFGFDDDGLYMNGKLCWPVEPVTCLRPDGTTERCESRQTPLPSPRPAEAPPPPPPVDTTDIYDDSGGVLPVRQAEWKRLADSGNDIAIRGHCLSGCTMVMIYVPEHRICFGEGAALGFHAVRSSQTGELLLSTTQWMVSHYPQNILMWIKNRGGAEKMTIENFWMLYADELWDMGYRKCAPEPQAPDPHPIPPMTIIKRER
jgi:hypothetical protein